MSLPDLSRIRRDEFEALFDELEEIEALQSDLGHGGIESDAARRNEIECRLLDLVSKDVSTEERRRYARIPCDLWVEVRTSSGASAGSIVDIGVGGALVAVDLAVAIRDSVSLEVERQPGLVEHGLEVRGSVAWTDPTAPRGQRFGVAFTATDSEAVTAVRRLIVALLRKRLAIPPLAGD